VLVSAPNVDIFEIHQHPVQTTYLTNLATLIDDAKAHGKGCSMNESEADHATLAELTANTPPRTVKDSRETMTHWGPIYRTFASGIFALGHWKGCEMASIARTEEAFATLDWYSNLSMLGCLQYSSINNPAGICSSAQLTPVNTASNDARWVAIGAQTNPPQAPPILNANGLFLQSLFTSY
jgi:hypothetical protein